MNYQTLLSPKAIPVLLILAGAILVFLYAPNLYKFTRFYDPADPNPEPGTFDRTNVIRAIRFFSGVLILLILVALVAIPLL